MLAAKVALEDAYNILVNAFGSFSISPQTHTPQPKFTHRSALRFLYVISKLPLEDRSTSVYLPNLPTHLHTLRQRNASC